MNTNQNTTMFKVKRALKNKNTVTIIATLLVVTILLVGYQIRVRDAVKPIRVPYAKVTIQPRTKITDAMIGYEDISSVAVKGNIILDAQKYIIGKYSNYNTIIPAGSTFYTDTVVDKSELPDVALLDIPDGYTLYYLTVSMLTSYTNSILPGNFIDIYLSTKDETGKALVGKLISNVKVLAVKTSDGLNVFENSDERRTPSVVLFAVPDEYHVMLRQVDAINSYNVATRINIIPIPNTLSYKDPTTGQTTEPTVNSKYLKEYIERLATQVPYDAVVETPQNNEESNTTE